MHHAVVTAKYYGKKNTHTSHNKQEKNKPDYKCCVPGKRPCMINIRYVFLSSIQYIFAVIVDLRLKNKAFSWDGNDNAINPQRRKSLA
ncbi:hypothetical protein ENASMMO064B1_14895 [Enterobacter asburiae]